MQVSHKFSGKLSEGLSKPSQRFVDEMIYGLTASQSVMLSEISRSLNESIPLIKTENRLCRNLGKRELCMHLQRSVACEQSKYIKNESLLILDLSDISKKYAEHMQYLGKVRDGSEGVIANGYWTAQVLGVEGDQLIPLYGHLYSASAPEFRSENLEIFRVIQFVSHLTGAEEVNRTPDLLITKQNHDFFSHPFSFLTLSRFSLCFKLFFRTHSSALERIKSHSISFFWRKSSESFCSNSFAVWV